VGDYFEEKGKDSSPSGNEPSSNGDSNKTLDKAVSWRRRVRARMDDHSKHTRLQRLISYSVAIVWSFLLLIFFNFFHEYLAYYRYEVVEGMGQWMREPLLTPEFSAVLPVLNIALILSILGNGVLIVRDRYLLRQGVSIILHAFGLAAVLTFLTVFPFNFDVVPFPAAPQVLSIIAAIVFIATAIGLVVGIVVRVVRIVITSIRAKS